MSTQDKWPMFGFIGTGNMGGALARALRRRVPGENVLLSNRTYEKAALLAAELGCAAERDNQAVSHERCKRELSMEASRNVKAEGKENNLLELIAQDPAFNMSLEELKKTMDPAKYTGRSAVQVENYLARVIAPVLKENQELLGMKAEINV